MSGCIEIRKCSICGKNHIQVNRKYYYYKINCECCGAKHKNINVHFEIVYHCSSCIPKPPRRISFVPSEDILIQ